MYQAIDRVIVTNQPKTLSQGIRLRNTFFVKSGVNSHIIERHDTNRYAARLVMTHAQKLTIGRKQTHRVTLFYTLWQDGDSTGEYPRVESLYRLLFSRAQYNFLIR